MKIGMRKILGILGYEKYQIILEEGNLLQNKRATQNL